MPEAIEDGNPGTIPGNRDPSQLWGDFNGAMGEGVVLLARELLYWLMSDLYPQVMMKGIPMVARSFVIPVLDFSPHSAYNIRTLLDDLSRIQGEVICIFNSPEVFEALRSHERIDKFVYNKLNVGVTRSWNLGLHLSEGRTVFIMNADVHVEPSAVDEMEHYLFGLPRAVIVGPQGSLIDFKKFRVLRYFERGQFSEPVRTHDVSGFLFSIHRERFFEHRLIFDDRFSPCFCEEWDMGLQVIQAELACYAVPVKGFDHQWGVSAATENTAIRYFGKTMYRDDILRENRRKFLEKWFGSDSKLRN